ncbi:cytochrome P450 family protein [Actinophytocola gossypii]|uniref:P450-derived glycosyltransferase activator n=1 Tax=Actinophytocola gossypii TaxID=2812003 RepID=A0ABT2JB90_9PSEU|nr:P450-derived glycosyltransferase activator [Actinophytocola gossypii]MCT2585135.1 P450-derived glycosyltransferase activator [Actinophytocola gossypii]
MTRHQIDPRTVTESDLARHLLAARGIQWMRGNRGDPYALILRAQGIDPHRLFPGLRGAPVIRQSETDVWVTVDHAAGRQILADPRLRLRDQAAAKRRKRVFTIDSRTSLKHVLSVDDAVLAMDRAEHDRLRPIAERILAPDADEVTRVFAETLAKTLANTSANTGGRFDLMTDFARPATVSVLAELTGVPAGARDDHAAACAGAGPALDATLCPPTLAMTTRLVAAYDAIRETFAGHDAGHDEDARAVGLLAAVAGTEVTTNLICDAVLALLDHPDQWRLLRAEPDRAPDAVEEALRFAPPVRLESRIAAEDAEVAGQAVGRGDQVVVLVDAANRDPAVFAEPDRFDLTRTSSAGHLALPEGSSTSLVAAPARLLAGAALRVLADTVPELRTDGDVVRRMRSPVVRGIARCPVASQ